MPLALTGYEWGLLLTALVFIVFALVVAIVVPRNRPAFPAKYLGWFIAACIVLFVGQMTAVLLLAELGEEHEVAAETGTENGETEPEPTEPAPTEPEPTEPEPTEPEPTEPAPTEPAPGGEGDPAAGKEVFLANCGQCHTLADAGTSGTVGPNLDDSQPPLELAVDRVTNGQGVMPAFGGDLSEQEILDVATYVSTAAGG